MKQETWTVQEYREYLKREEKSSKYHNKITYVDGIPFDSQKEAQRYSELKLLERAGEITDLELQPVFILEEGIKKGKRKIRDITYIADFRYKDLKTGKTVVEDIKGFKTKDFRIKQKLFDLH